MKKVSFAISYSLYLFFQGFLFPQPSISINQNSFSSALYTGDTEVQSMVLSNSGSEPLGWYLSINYIDDNFYRVNSFFYRNQEPHLRIEPVIDHEDEDIFIPNNRSFSERDSRDINLNIGDVVLNASLNDNTMELYQVNQNGEVSFLYPTEGQALVVEEDGSIVFAVYDIAGECDFTGYYYDPLVLKRLKPNETIEHIACLPDWGGDFDKDANGNIIYITEESLYKISPDGIVEIIAEEAFNNADAVSVHPITGDYFVALEGEIIRVNQSGEIFLVYQDFQMFPNLEGLAFTEEGTLIIADEDARALYSLNDDGTLETIAQGGILDELEDVVVDQDGNYIVSCDTYDGYDQSLGSLVKVTPEGEATYLVERYFAYIDNIGIFSRRNYWLSVVPEEGEVSSSESMELDILFDAAGLYGGEYEATIEVYSNDPETQQIDIPVILTVTGAPDISVSDEVVDFGTLYTNYGGSREIVISNDGTDALEVSSITVDNPSYSLSFSEATVPYNDEVILTIEFMPLEDGDYSSVLTIVSNDVDEPEVIMLISGSSIAPPIISVSPTSLSSNLLTGETDTQFLTISNSGGSDLSFSVNIINTDARWSMPELERGVDPITLTLEDIRNLWNRNETPSFEVVSEFQQTQNETRPTRNWQLLANDPQDNNSPYDTENIYYEVTDTTLNFKYEYYEPWEASFLNTVALLYLDVDSNPETGENLDEYYGADIAGIDMIIYSTGFSQYDGAYYDIDGIYVFSEYYGGFTRIEELSWADRQSNSREFSFGVPFAYFEGLASLSVASISGSLEYDFDIIPNQGMAELSFAPAWLSVDQESGIVPAGSDMDLAATFDAAGLYGGEYEATIEVYSNDPETQQIDIPVILSVTGAPDISVSDEVVDFGTLFTNYGGSREIVISNDGTDALEVSNITVDNTSYSLSFSEATVPFNDEVILTIEFMPLEDGDYSSVLTIVSNDVDEPEVVIPISGSSIAPPIVGVNPNNLSSNLLTGETETQFLTVSNNGGSDLLFNLNAINADVQRSFSQPQQGTDANRLTLEDLSNLWNGIEVSSLEPSLRSQPMQIETRTTRNWQLLANDPQDNNSFYDTENIYYGVTDTTLNFKYEYYENWGSPYENTVAILMINVDNNIQTGATIDDYGMIEGIDMMIYSLGVGYNDDDGVYIFDDTYFSDFIQVDNIVWENREENTNEFSFGVPIEYFEGLASMQVASYSGSFNDDGPDLVPNEGTVELFFSVPWLSLEQESGIVPAGASVDLGVTFDATGLFGGDYEAIIELSTNDPLSSVIEVPVYLSVTGVPIVDFPNQADFGEVYVGYSDTLEYVIANIGTDLLLVEDITFQDMWLSSEQENLSIAPFQEAFLHLIAEIDNPDTYVTTMSFTTNDLQNAIVDNITVGAIAVNPPVMNVSQSEFVFTHSIESSEINEFVISNTGGSGLAWQMEFESTGGSSDEWFFFEKTDYSDFASEENQDRITNNVWITRENSGPIFNYYLENVPEYGCDSQTPSGTLWSPNPKEESSDNNYVPFIQMTGCYPPGIVGDTISVWLVQDDLKLNVVFESWTSGGQGGGVSYYRERVTPQWIEISPMEGFVGVDESQQVLISVNSFGLEEGEHSTVLLLNSNDPETHSMSVPVDLVYVLGIEDKQFPNSYSLYPAYPNPFNPTTMIRFDVPESLYNNVVLNVFDIKGRLVETILDKELTPGSHAIRWDAKSKPSGVYFLRMNAEKYSKTYKMILMK